jgi:hypothetical protein
MRLMKRVRGAFGPSAATFLLAWASAVEAHRPPPGHALEHTAQAAGHVVEVMVVPKEPRAGERAEIILAIREQATGLPFKGYLTFLVAPLAGEAGPLVIPLEFSPGQFESAHVFREPGVHGLSVVFDAEAAEHRVGPIPVRVRPASRVAGGVALGLGVLTAVTYAAAFRRSRREPPPGGGRG